MSTEKKLPFASASKNLSIGHRLAIMDFNAQQRKLLGEDVPPDEASALAEEKVPGAFQAYTRLFEEAQKLIPR